MANRLLEALMNKPGDPQQDLVNAIIIRQYQRERGYPISGMKFWLDGQWRDLDDILAGGES